MKIRIAASIALAAGLALGASGCSLIAVNGTEVQYAPSDGVQTEAGGVALRNILLIADESGENFNVVFTGVNNTEAPAKVSMEFSAESGQAAIGLELEPGMTSFGNSADGQATHVISLPNVIAGSTVKTYFTINGAGDNHEFVPVLDGTLAEYEDLVLSTPAAPTKQELKKAAEEEQASIEEALAEKADADAEDAE